MSLIITIVPCKDTGWAMGNTVTCLFVGSGIPVIVTNTCIGLWPTLWPITEERCYLLPAAAVFLIKLMKNEEEQPILIEVQLYVLG